MEQITSNSFGEQTLIAECPKKSLQLVDAHRNSKNCPQTEPLLTKTAVEFLLDATLKKKVCKYCLNLSSELSEVDQVLQVADKGTMYKVSIMDMIAAFHPFQHPKDINLPSKICNKCLNRTISAYLFTQQCERAERAIQNCFNEIYEKFEKLDPLIPHRKQGRKKLRMNHNVLQVSHAKVINYAEPIIHLVNKGSALLNNCQNHVISELECLKCWQVLPDLPSLVRHQKTHPNTMWIHCRLCGNSFAKLLHWKKHMKSCHSTISLNAATSANEELNTKFNCKECGAINENYLVHLQHLEKHKFKKVLDQLLAKKTDDLCTVCLDKGHIMVDLDKTVVLHGGCPELNGDRSLYSILGSTLPDPKQSYKFKQLVLTNSANKLNMVKKSTRHNSKQEIGKNAGSENENGVFDFSGPLRMLCKNAKHYTEVENAMYSFHFIFSGPTNLDTGKSYDGVKSNILSSPVSVVLNELKHNAINPFTVSEVENFISKDTTIAKATVPDVENEISKKPEAAVNNIRVSSARDVIENTARKMSCKSCWLFKKPNCGDCMGIKKQLVSGTENIKCEKIENKKACQYCWVFEKTGICNICTKKKLIALKITKELNIINYKNKITPEKVMHSKTKHAKPKEEKKIKTFIGNESEKKKPKLQCNVCLTINDNNRGVCFCCGINVGVEEKATFEIKMPTIENNKDLKLACDETMNVVIEDVDMVDITMKNHDNPSIVTG